MLMKQVAKESHRIIWIVVAIIGLLFMVWMIDFIRCRIKSDGCTVAWWRFNSECSVDTDCDDDQSCVNNMCVSSYRRKNSKRKASYSKYEVKPVVYTIPVPDPPAPPSPPVPQKPLAPSPLSGYTKSSGAPHIRRT